MKKTNIFLLGLAFLSGLFGCTPASSNTQPNLTSDKLTIKVGESAIITLIAPTRTITSSPDLPTQVNDTGFLYTPDPNQPVMNPNQTINLQSAPYLLDINGALSGPSPSAFPISSHLEVILPITGSDNIPSRVTVAREGDQSKATFTIKGKSLGTVILKGGFLSNIVEVPNNFKRTPFVPVYDGIVTIQVVP